MNAEAAAPTAARMNFSYGFFWCILRTAFPLYFRWRLLHCDRVPATGPVILASNHASYLDPPLIGAALKRHINFLARDTLFPIPVLGALLRSWRVVPVDRDGGGGAGLRGILDRLLNGGAILLFPEGTRTRDGQLQSARSGIGLIVAKTEAPVVPVRVFGSFAAYNRHTWVPRPHRIVIKFGKPLDFAGLRREVKDCARPRAKVIYQEIADGIMTEMARMEPVPDCEG